MLEVSEAIQVDLFGSNIVKLISFNSNIHNKLYNTLIYWTPITYLRSMNWFIKYTEIIQKSCVAEINTNLSDISTTLTYDQK